MPQTAAKEKVQDAPELTQEVEAPAEKPFVKAPPLVMSRFQLAVEVNQSWRVNCPMDVTPEQVMHESFWANVSMLLRTGDEIHVFPDDMSWELVLHVAGRDHLWAHVLEKTRYNLRPALPHVKLPSIYKIQFAGSHHKWRVLREGEPLKDGFETESLANRYAANHEAAVNR